MPWYLIGFVGRNASDLSRVVLRLKDAYWTVVILLPVREGPRWPIIEGLCILP